MLRKKDEPYLTTTEKWKYFMSAHWRGVLIVCAPVVLIGILAPFPPQKYQWTAYTLLLMATYWVTECIPLAVTSFFPVVIFPLVDVLDTRTVCACYMNDSIMMFVGSLVLAYSVEQSGLHKRLAYFSIRIIGYSHLKLLLAMCSVTTFVSMWITNTAATTMMVPINFALLKVFEDQKVLVIYEKNSLGDEYASDTTTVYFCAATFSATVGGIGTLVGTGTNLVFKGLFVTEFPSAPEYLSFPKFSAFAAPYMVVLEVFVYFYLVIVYFGFLRPGSATAKASKMPIAAQNAAKATILADVKRMGRISYWELKMQNYIDILNFMKIVGAVSEIQIIYTRIARLKMVCLLFGGAMISFFCRSPQLFPGWGDRINDIFGITDGKFIRDSALAMLVAFFMFLLPRNTIFFKNFTAKYHEDLPKTPSYSVLDWALLNSQMPFAFSFLLGGGFALSTAAKTSGLNDKIGGQLSAMKGLPNYAILLIVIIAVVFITNFASNVAVCNVFTPLCMQLASKVDQNPLWYCIASGFAASYCFMLPVGTPGNLIVQSAAKIPTSKMIVAGFGPTISTIFVTWGAMYFWAPVIWSDLHKMPDWIKEGKPT